MLLLRDLRVLFWRYQQPCQQNLLITWVARCADSCDQLLATPSVEGFACGGGLPIA